MGTADYMAPEQASDSRTVDIRADIYSLGCTLYKLLSGQAPFGGPEYHATLDKLNAHVQKTPPPISQLVADIPQELSAILDRMLAKNPADRFPTPAEVAKAIEPFCAGANLIDVITRAISIDPLSLRERARVRAGESADIRTKPLPAPSRLRSIPIFIAVAVAFMAAGFALGIIIKINKDGKETTVDVPLGSTATVNESGNIDLRIAAKPEARKKTVSSPGAEFKTLQGPWKIVHLEKGKEAEGIWMSITDLMKLDYIHIYEGWLDMHGLWIDYSIDPTAEPKTIDFIWAGKLAAWGIYKIEGGRLTMIFTKYFPTLKSQQRPNDFAVDENSTDVLLVLERYKPSEDEQAMSGADWQVESEIHDGKAAPVGGKKCRFSNRSINFDKDGFPPKGGLFSGFFTIDPTKIPKTITINAWMEVNPEKMMGRVKLSGIYKFDGDRLTIAYRTGDKPPEEFESTPGSGISLLVLKKASETAAVPNPALDAEPGSDREPQGRIKVKSDIAPEAPDEKAKPAERSVTFYTAQITRGDITAMVSASGTIQPEGTAEVSAQVSGQIVSLGDDPRGAGDPKFKGKTIDYNSPVEQGTVLARIDDAVHKLKVEQEKAVVRRAEAELALAKSKYESAKKLDKNTISENDLLAAKLAVNAAEAALEQAKAALEQAQINLERTIITSPISGVIIVRRVNVGQNVAPRTSDVPSLFFIAKDLKKMQIWASVNEADIGRIHEGMPASFTVDAFPKQTFTGKVTQIHCDASMVHHYAVIVAFDNPDGKLWPDMTANVKFEVNAHRDVLCVQNSILRWMPRPELVEDLGVTIVDGNQDSVQKAFDALKDMYTTLDKQNRGIIWVISQDGKHLRRIVVQTGLSNGALTEISGPDVKEGMEVVIGHTFRPNAARGNPFSKEGSNKPEKR